MKLGNHVQVSVRSWPHILENSFRSSSVWCNNSQQLTAVVKLVNSDEAVEEGQVLVTVTCITGCMMLFSSGRRDTKEVFDALSTNGKNERTRRNDGYSNLLWFPGNGSKL